MRTTIPPGDDTKDKPKIWAIFPRRLQLVARDSFHITGTHGVSGVWVHDENLSSRAAGLFLNARLYEALLKNTYTQDLSCREGKIDRGSFFSHLITP